MLDVAEEVRLHLRLQLPPRSMLHGPLPDLKGRAEARRGGERRGGERRGEERRGERRGGEERGEEGRG